MFLLCISDSLEFFSLWQIQFTSLYSYFWERGGEDKERREGAGREERREGGKRRRGEKWWGGEGIVDEGRMGQGMNKWKRRSRKESRGMEGKKLRVVESCPLLLPNLWTLATLLVSVIRVVSDNQLTEYQPAFFVCTETATCTQCRLRRTHGIKCCRNRTEVTFLFPFVCCFGRFVCHQDRFITFKRPRRRSNRSDFAEWSQSTCRICHSAN